ncbi:MAG TPA: HAD family hydrolase [Chthonomonadales bacterium]|nr:HAD family hydrolase [Chthonomonadales bacterium]
MFNDRPAPSRPSRYRLLFVDLDGTLVAESDSISDANLGALARARHAGCEPVVCTGRSRYSSRRVVERLGGAGWLVAMNGAIVVHCTTGDVIRHVRLAPDVFDEAGRVIARAGMAPICFGVHDDDRTIYADRRKPLPPQYERRQSRRLVFVDDVPARVPGPPVMVAAYGPPEEVLRARDVITDELGERVHVIISGSPRYSAWVLEVHDPRSNKAVGAAFLARHLGVDRAATAAIGDHLNDVPLLRWVGLGIAVADGVPEARDAAHATTRSSRDDGVAAAIDHWIAPAAGP